MPLPIRPAGPVSPADLLWRHELKEHNAALLRRMNSLEAKFTDQERRFGIAEEAATTCTGMVGQLNLVKSGFDQLEAKQQDFMSDVQKRLVDMDKDVGEFRKTQERVQKLISSYRELGDSIVHLSSLGSRVEDIERELQGLKNSVTRKHVHELENLDARLEALELQRSRETAQIRTMQDDFMRERNGEFQALRKDVAKIMEARRPAEVQQPYMQVPRSPDMDERTTNLATPTNKPNYGLAKTTTAKEAALHQIVRSRVPKAQQGPAEVDTQGTTQTSVSGKEIEDLDLDTAFFPYIPRPNVQAPASKTRPRKKPKLSHPESQLKGQPKAQLRTQLKAQSKLRSKAQPKNQPATQTMAPATAHPRLDQHHKVQPHIALKATSRATPSMIVKLPVNTSKKRPRSPVPAPIPVKERPVASVPRQQVGRAPKEQSKLQENQQQLSQPARRSRRRSGNATFYELGWDQTQQPQKTAGPVYDSTSKISKPLKTKPRRLPPVPDE